MNKNIIFSLIIIILIIIGGVYLNKPQDQRDSTKQNQTIDTLGKDNLNNTNSSTTSASQSIVASYKLSDVAKHGKPGDCWSTVNGKVYDLTSWPEKHPGGDKAIFAICGIDGTKAFENKHGGQEKPANVLDSFYIGNLVQ